MVDRDWELKKIINEALKDSEHEISIPELVQTEQ